MKVKELKEILSKCNDNDDVIIASDSEGNNFYALHDVDTSDCSWCEKEGEIILGLRKITPELENQGYTDEDVIDGEYCVVFWAQV